MKQRTKPGKVSAADLRAALERLLSDPRKREAFNRLSAEEAVGHTVTTGGSPEEIQAAIEFERAGQRRKSG